jgi:hypothetical protein
MTFLATLHDATLLGVDVGWAEGTLRVTVRTVGGKRNVIAKGLTSLECPRRSPWGRSNSINRAWTEEAPVGTRLLIEMQSGDVIVATVASIEFEADSV